MNKHAPIALLGAVAIAVLAATSTAVQADGTKDGFYGGLALIGSGGLVEEGAGIPERDGSKGSIGGFVGYKQKVYKNFFIGGEAFINDTNHSQTYQNGDKLSFGTQYGVKAHFGYERDWGSVYAILGAANFDYDVTLSGSQVTGKDTLAVFGLGTSYQINEQLSANLEIMGTGKEIDIAGKADRGVGLSTLRLGLAYHF
jgi:hypothetical protein